MTDVSHENVGSTDLIGFRLSDFLAARVNTVAAQLARSRGEPVTKGAVVQEAVRRGLAIMATTTSHQLSDAAGLAGNHQFRVHVDHGQVERVWRRVADSIKRAVPRVFI